MNVNELINLANALDHKYQEIDRTISKNYRKKFFAARKARKDGDTELADKLAAEGRKLQEKLRACTDEWLAARRDLDLFFLDDEITDELENALKQAAEEARAHLDTIKSATEKLAALAAFAKFLENTVRAISVIAG